MGGESVYSNTEKLNVPAHRRDIGMVFQSYAIWPHMTVFDNVAFPLLHGRRKISRGLVSEKVMSALALVHLKDLADRPAPFISGGQQQRVALARAIVHEPKLLLLDEPLSNLDAKLREEMRFELRELVSRLKITTLYVTHDQVEALSMSDRIAVMQSGRIVQEGTPREIFFEPKDQFIADFMGKSNFITGRVVECDPTVRSAKIEASVGTLHCVTSCQVEIGEKILLAVRPSGIEVSRRASSADENSFAGEIQSLTFVGDFLECHVKAGHENLRAMLDPYQEFKVGERICVSIPRGRLATVARL
jgi:iron(III) transport system ATP-binding protein